ncbi:MAG: peptide-methionine (S)-S-oxide reductase MsrA [Proteobacteria bacterium]|nr:peptide-methionine (S)-S-oxide reductase MsrA [Pseudomonadota bacterium]
MNATSIRSIPRTLLAASVLAFSLCGYSHAEGEVKPLPNPTLDAPVAKTSGQQTAVFAAGCFWGIEAVFKHVNGVISSTSGYSGGSADTATYQKVSGGLTGHAEAVKVVFDPSKVSYGTLLKVLFSAAHDATQLNRQGPDSGTQYVGQLKVYQVYAQPIVTQIVPLKAFYQAEDYHLDYLARNLSQPYIVHNDLPKLAALKLNFPALYRSN